MAVNAAASAAARHEFADPKRFDKVIVRSDLKAEHPVGFTIPGADHQDGCVVVLAAQLAAEIQASKPRQHQIENDQIHSFPAGAGEGRQSLSPVGAGLHHKAFGSEGFVHGLPD